MPRKPSPLEVEVARIVDERVSQLIKPLERELSQLRRQLGRLPRGPARSGGGTAASAPARARAPRDGAADRARLTPASIRQHRLRLGLSQAQLAALVGVTPVAVYYWESGRTTPRGASREGLLELRTLGVREVKRRLGGVSRAVPGRRGGGRQGAPRRKR